MLPVGNRKIELVVWIPRLHCKHCGAIKQPRLGFADPKKHYTRSLERFVVDLCQLATIQDVALLTGLSWDTVKEIHKKYLRRQYKSFNLKKVRRIAIDEVYLGKKRKFMTLVLDLRTGRVLHIGQGKGKEALKGFWRRLKRSKATIEAAAYYMKERLRVLFQCLDRDIADRELTAWIHEARSCGIRILKDAAKKLLQWKPFILNWYNHRISTGKLEATNRKIGTLQRNACGYRDEEYLKLRIYNIHTSTYALTG